MSDQLKRILDETLAYFLCEYPPTSPKKQLKEIIRKFLTKFYSEDNINIFIEKRLDQFRELLINEYNFRIENNLSIRFEVADPLGEGHIIKGKKSNPSDNRLIFQDALQAISPEKFEDLAAILLKRLDCNSVFRTPRSHDQGVDAFGYRTISPALSRAVSHKLVWIAQAKHYITHGVSTNAVRELIGSNELLVSKIFSTVDEKYKELEILPYSPAALLLLTTHEMPSTVRRLAERSGIYVFEATDLYEIFSQNLNDNIDEKSLLNIIDTEIESIPFIS